MEHILGSTIGCGAGPQLATAVGRTTQRGLVEEDEEDEEPGSYHEWKSGPVMAIAIGGQSSPLRDISNSGDTFLTCSDGLDADNSFCGRGGGPINSFSKLPLIRRPVLVSATAHRRVFVRSFNPLIGASYSS
jgi:hypothetical protein